MSVFQVDTQEFITMLQALLPFTSANKDSTPDQPAVEELIFGNLTGSGELALTTYESSADWAIGMVRIQDADGELVDFAIHRDEVPALVSQFRAKVFESTLAIEVNHSEFETVTVRDEKRVTEYGRRTLLHFQEEGKLFGNRVTQFAGADGRQYSLRNIWVNAAGNIAPSQVVYATCDPSDFKVLTKATKLLGIPVIHMTGSHTALARIGENFIARLWLSTSDQEFMDTSKWANILETASAGFLEHKIYDDETEQE